MGVLDINPQSLLAGDREQWEVFFISRLPRLLAILCTGVGMSVAGLIMQQLCSNKFVSPTTGATISSAQFGILLALLFMPSSTLWSRALFAFACAILGTWVFVWFIQRIQFKDVVMVPLVGIMFGNVIGGITNYLSYKYEMTQAMSSWLVGHFSIVLSGNYELVWLSVPLVVLAFVFANHFNIVGMGKDFSKNLGVPYNLVLFLGLSIAAMITASVVVVVGSIYHATNMMRTVRKLCDELGKTVILVLHEINYAAFYSDYICAFVDGKVAKFGTVEEVMTKEDLSAIYQVDFEILEIEGKPLSIYYGTIKEADLEAVMSCEPDVIFIGGRLASSYDALSEIAPVVYLSTDTEQGVVESVRKNANTIASLFGLEEEVDSLMVDFDSRIAALAEFAEGKTAIVGLVTSGGFNVLGNDGRCSMICREVGFENIGVDAEIDTATHGNEASFEFVVEKDPDYIFVLDRDAAIQTEGAQLAQEIVENELVKGTRAYTDGHIVYLSSPAVWYTAEGGITALDVMLQDLESELLSQ